MTYIFYPNPTNGILIIRSLRNIEFLKIYDLRGKIVFQKYCDSKQENINLHKLYKGSYIIQINTQEGTISHKNNYSMKKSFLFLSVILSISCFSQISQYDIPLSFTQTLSRRCLLS